MATDIQARDPVLPPDEILAHIQDSLLKARADIVGIVVFGSFARGEAWRDIDVIASDAELLHASSSTTPQRGHGH